MSEHSKIGAPKRRFGCLFWSIIAVVLFLFLGILLGPITGSPQHARALMAGYDSELIGLFLKHYAADHQGNYPSGNSSTEIFQKLLDGEYITDPAIFYSPSPGKIKPPEFENYKLKPENVCFDITIPIQPASSRDLPLVFMTGYRVTYLPGASAAPLSDTMKTRNPCIAVYYNNGAFAIFRNTTWFGKGEYRSRGGHQNQDFLPDEEKEIHGGRLQRDGTISNFIPTTFDPAGIQYRQLTPTGPLPR